MTTLKIGEREVGRGQRPYVVAECCNNFQGSMEIAKRMVTTARECGADAVKFQFRQLPGRIGIWDLGELRALAHATGLEFLCTAYTYDGLAFVDPLVVAHKVGAAEVDDEAYLAEVVKRQKPVIVSTGGMSMQALIDSPSLRSMAPVILLQCTSVYPTPLEDTHLGAMTRLRALRAGGPVGYSDHTGRVDAVIAALALGADMVEVHFTLSRNLPGPDQACSHEPAALKAICEFARKRDAVLDSTKEFWPAEHEKLDLFRGKAK